MAQPAHAAVEDADALSLRPFHETDRAPLQAMLDNPRLYRRRFVEGLGEHHPLAWDGAHRTFVVRHGGDVLGVAELVRDDEEPDTWSFAVILDRHAHQGDGGRCATALVDYAFQVLDAEQVWFWVRRDNIAVQRFGARLGFECMCSMKMPGGEPCEMFELDQDRWAMARRGAMHHYFRKPVCLTDGERVFRGRGEGFVELN